MPEIRFRVTLAARCLALLAVSALLHSGLPAFAQNDGSRFAWGRIAGQRSTVVTTDGVKLFVIYSEARHSTATVVMVPMLGNTMEPFSELDFFLQRNGVGTLNFDLRGHGQSTGTLTGAIDYHSFDSGAEKGRAWSQIPSDIGAVCGFLQQRGVAPENIIIAGAGIGANATMLYAVSHPEIRRLILMSPADVYRGLTAWPAAEQLRGRDLLLVCSDNDTTSRQAAARIAKSAENNGNRVMVHIPPGSGTLHGNAMVDAPLSDLITRWVLLGQVETRNK